MKDNSSYCFLFLSDTPQKRRKTGQIQHLKALKEFDDDLFPNIYALLKICATIPATNCECERSASSLKAAAYNRAYMGQERLSSLAVMHIHY